jgi:hypothetical protein
MNNSLKTLFLLGGLIGTSCAYGQVNLADTGATFIANDTAGTGLSATTAQGDVAALGMRVFPASSRFRVTVVSFNLAGLTGSFAGAELQFDFATAQNNTRTINLLGVGDIYGNPINASTLDYANASFVLQPTAGGPAYNGGQFQFVGGAENVLPAVGSSFTDGSGNLVVENLASFSNTSGSTGIKDFSGTTLESFLAAEQTSSDDVTFIIANSPTSSDSAYTIDGDGSASPIELILPNINPVPEPTTLALAGIGSLGLLLVRRRR